MAAERRLGRRRRSRRTSSRCFPGAGSRRRRTTRPRRSRISRTRRRWRSDARRSTCRPRRRRSRASATRPTSTRCGSIGKSDSAARTAEQTAIARLWAGVATDRHRHGHQLPRDLEQHRARRRARAPAVARRDRARVRARERRRSTTVCRRRRPASSSMGCGARSRRSARRTRDLNPATDAGSDLAAADHDAAVPVVCRQHGLHRRQRRPRAAARVRHQRHPGHGDVAAVRRAAGRHAPVRRLLAGRRGAVHGRGSAAASTTASTRSPASRSARQAAEFVFANFMTPRADDWNELRVRRWRSQPAGYDLTPCRRAGDDRSRRLEMTTTEQCRTAPEAAQRS